MVYVLQWQADSSLDGLLDGLAGGAPPLLTAVAAAAPGPFDKGGGGGSSPGPCFEGGGGKFDFIAITGIYPSSCCA